MPGTAAAQGSSGFVDFCSKLSNGQPADYDNSHVQTYGLFTDVDHSGWRPPNAATVTYRGDEINDYTDLVNTNPRSDSSPKPEKCALSFYGDPLLVSNNHADMWITILGAPGTVPPKNSCWGLDANIWFDNGPQGGWNNSKGVGIVSNYDTSTKKGLFFGIFDAGNTESIALLSFDASPNPPNNMFNPTVIQSVGLTSGSIQSAGGGQPTSKSYHLQLSICTTTTALDAIGSVQPATSPNPPGTCPLDKASDQQCFKYHGALPSGYADTGAVGLAALVPTGGGFLDAYVTKFRFVGTSQNPD